MIPLLTTPPTTIPHTAGSKVRAHHQHEKSAASAMPITPIITAATPRGRRVIHVNPASTIPSIPSAGACACMLAATIFTGFGSTFFLNATLFRFSIDASRMVAAFGSFPFAAWQLTQLDAMISLGLAAPKSMLS